MKTATVTWITYNNYGTELQAYSLQRFLINNGIDNIIISDKEIIPYRIEKSKFFDTKILKEKELFFPKRIFSLLYVAKRNFRYRYYINSQKKFEKFKKRNLKIDFCYSREKMETLNEKFDCFICGSDQVWSVADINFDGFFFLNFVNKKKIAYAPSMGTASIPITKQEQIKKWLSDFYGISVREKQTSDELTQILKKDVAWVCDPTLLNDKLFWQNIAKKATLKSRSKFVVCYFLENKDWYYKYAKEYCNRNNFKMIIIPNKMEYCDQEEVYKGRVGPLEFISLIQHSEYVITDSYHGLLFSLIFEKQFSILKRFNDSAYNSQNIRIYSILEYLDLINILISEENYKYYNNEMIDYDIVTNKINKFREFSRQWLLGKLDYENNKK
ncbi:polysaccharide pyruvyl transferase family protein [Thomasclavelia cocleata]|uniref:Polysaccharide pyruvyl transferase n=1 Tax=Thomasclavelia cocleata TaxID=69824 RepID=A0A1I0CWG6_9FIRM|nr:polysaccharide pyruvyl transferase family protein [Thomasclavelia cocleata]MCR1959785.1 polysaccharide pyruvyl transferase family protein [Thomasclavelia cocleata]NDO41027.1 polysaccharide pyruvyl transferase family protein [Thomasclavelia cocleata]PJN81557.1 polysaccharide pyruvyl transferase family protein [Thomasclavelia cocleata]SET24187.1 Polysaccharide pyruvyl transferase [Thomasclavelia cocleata]